MLIRFLFRHFVFVLFCRVQSMLRAEAKPLSGYSCYIKLWLSYHFYSCNDFTKVENQLFELYSFSFGCCLFFFVFQILTTLNSPLCQLHTAHSHMFDVRVHTMCSVQCEQWTYRWILYSRNVYDDFVNEPNEFSSLSLAFHLCGAKIIVRTFLPTCLIYFKYFAAFIFIF